MIDGIDVFAVRFGTQGMLPNQLAQPGDIIAIRLDLENDGITQVLA